MTAAAKFEHLQRRAREADIRAHAFRRDLDGQFQHRSFAPAGYKKRAAALQRASDRAWDLFWLYLVSITPVARRWGSGVPIAWLLTELTYADACTRGPLSMVPPPAYGSTPDQMREFARALRENE